MTVPLSHVANLEAGSEKARPRVLFVAHRVPYPPDRGDRIRSFHLLEYLARRADVYLAFLSEQRVAQQTIDVLEGICRRVAAVRLGRRARWVRAALSLAAGRTATEGLFRSPRLCRTLAAWAKTTQFDAVFIYCSSMVQYLGVPGLAEIPAVVDLVDVDSQKWLEYARQSRGPKRRLFRLEGTRLRRLEASAPGLAKAVLLVSDHESQLLRSFAPSDHIYSIPNGVDLDYFRPGESRVSGSRECVFVGALDYRANVDGLSWFCREIWPQVRRQHPDAVLKLVGSNPNGTVRRLAKLPGVELVGQVPDVRPYLQEAAVVVVPLRVARGLQNKVLEAMAMGKPVVATPQALEGIGATPGDHVCQATSPDQWVRKVGGLLSDPELCDRLGRAARTFVERRFCWETQLGLLADIFGSSGFLANTDPDNRTRQNVAAERVS